MTSPVLVVPTPVGEPGPDAVTGRWTGLFSVPVTDDEPVFAGHYPHFPIFPGVCVLECARAAAEAAIPPEAGELRLTAVESSRFLAAVRPGDVLEIEVIWTPREPGWRCNAKVATATGPAASARFHYRREAAS
ncbi:3-hydroxyacyl-ACP dehydratase FabZ family protein [Streptomyces anulatus]|uniref:3-hydroxyacyl-ACP dehydratase FabZ family protein n=1 Tax=Streptomyces anulatus TaxID=1892 RepID=UPI003B7B62EC